MRLFYRLCQLVQEQKGVLEPPELPAGYTTGYYMYMHILSLSWNPFLVHATRNSKGQFLGGGKLGSSEGKLPPSPPTKSCQPSWLQTHKLTYTHCL